MGRYHHRYFVAGIPINYTEGTQDLLNDEQAIHLTRCVYGDSLSNFDKVAALCTQCDRPLCEEHAKKKVCGICGSILCRDCGCLHGFLARFLHFLQEKNDETEE